MDKPKCRRVDAIAQSAAVLWPVRKYMTEMTVAVRRAHLDAALHGVRALVHVGRIDRLREARPAAPGVELVGRGEQRLPRHDVNVNAGFVVVEIFSAPRKFGRGLLRYAILLRR